MLLTLTIIHWIAIPLLGGAIGYFTNRLAVKMIFRPIRPVNILGIRVQGLMPRRQKEMAQSIGQVVGAHLVNHEDLMRGLQKVDLHTMLEDLFMRGMEPKIAELKSLPLIGGFLTDDRIAELRGALVQGILDHEEEIFEKLEQALEQGLDVQQLVADKVAAFPVERVEEMVLHVANRELRAIEILGGVLGLIIGIGQVLLLWGLGT